MGRNDPCWCGSGKKFKRCHLNRAQQSKVNLFEVAAAQRKHFSRKECLHPLADGGTCTRSIVRAHTVRRAADLVPLSRDRHVYQVRAEPEILVKTGGRPSPKLIGVNEASTFSGFCARHDAATFRPLEAGDFVASQEQCFLLFYRAWARETYLKESASRAIDIWRDADKGKATADQIAIQNFIAAYSRGTDLGVKTVNMYKALLDAAMLRGDFGIVQSAVYFFERPLDVVCSGATYPYWDLKGKEIQAFSPETHPAPLAISLLQAPAGGAAVLSWLSEHDDAPRRFEQSLRSERSLEDALVRVVFSALENVFARPDWWDGLVEAQRDALVARLTAYMSPFTETPPDSLVDDGLHYADWHLQSRREV